MAEEMEYKVVSDGRRLDVLLSEETGLSRSRVASLMEEGRCVSAGKECRKAGTKLPEGQEVVLAYGTYGRNRVIAPITASLSDLSTEE